MHPCTGSGRTYSSRICKVQKETNQRAAGKALAEQGRPPAEIARFTLETVASAVRRATDAARKRWPGLPVLCSGGVASSRLLRTVMSDAAFAGPQYSTDNAMGAAILAWRSLRQEAEA